jgi:hypothetical protein
VSSWIDFHSYEKALRLAAKCETAKRNVQLAQEFSPPVAEVSAPPRSAQTAFPVGCEAHLTGQLFNRLSCFEAIYHPVSR